MESINEDEHKRKVIMKDHLWRRVSKRTGLCFLLMATACLSLSCNKQTQARRLVQTSEKLYVQARTALLAWDLKGCQIAAAKAEASAKKAARILPSGPGSETIANQVQKCSNMLGVFQDPSAAIRFWHGVLVEGDIDLGVFILDTDRLVEDAFARRIQNMSEQEVQALKDTFTQSCRLTLETYKDVLSTWELTNVTGTLKGQEAEVICEVRALNGDRKYPFWLHRPKDIWQLYDFAMARNIRLADSLKALEILLPEETSLTEFLKNKGIFDAFGEIQGAEKLDMMFAKKPLIGHYIKLNSRITLSRKGREVSLEPGVLLKIIDQNFFKDGTPNYFLRTTEADPSDSATGIVSPSVGDYVGTDETEIWGTDSSTGESQ